MSIDYFEYQENVATNLVLFMRKMGYSRLSLSKLTGIPRGAIDQIINCDYITESDFNLYIEAINQAFDLPVESLLDAREDSSTPTRIEYSARSPEAQELIDGLHNILDIYSLYLK